MTWFTQHLIPLGHLTLSSPQSQAGLLLSAQLTEEKNEAQRALGTGLRYNGREPLLLNPHSFHTLIPLPSPCTAAQIPDDITSHS